MGLAASVRDSNDYNEQGGKEKQAVPVVQLNLIRTVVYLSVAISKSEVVDMILPLFIESSEEGDASTSGLLQIRLLDAVSHIARSAEGKTLAWEAITERVEVVSTVTWLEDELEFNALHNPRSHVGGMSTISGAIGTYLLAVAF
ncbi:hypothetical protein NL676_039826 [Syzygium grande]|nr:hypothetical protein NL676_039826 [Syzygium grande]